MGFAAFLIVALVVVAAVGGGAAYLLASRAKRSYEASNEVVPGRPTRAPGSWAGSHDPEAVLHRRLRDAMAALRANRSFDDDGALIDVRVELEEQALALDDELVSVAALPRERWAEPLARVAEAVDAIEAAVTELATSSASAARPRLDEVLRRIRERATIVDQIRVELDEIPDGPPATTPEGEPAPGPPQVTDEHGRRQGQVS